MSYPHTRQLGSQPGVQLNKLRDNTEGFAADASDQVVAIVGRFRRGRIDAPFKVNRGNRLSVLGTAESIRISELNEAYVQAVESLDAGTYEMVVSRLVTDAAATSYGVFNITGTKSAFTVSADAPTAPYLFYFEHLSCFNDGIKAEVQADAVFAADGVTPVPTKVVTLRLREPNGNLMYEFTGSLDPLATDDYGKDYFIGSIIEAQSDDVKINVFAGASIPVTADCYGRNTDGTPKVATSGTAPLVLFTEGGTGYTIAHYDRAINALERGSYDFGYIISGGSQATALLSKLAQLAERANRHFVFDVPGKLTPKAAIAFIKQLSLDSHYCQAYWAPLQSDDPVNGGKAVIGTSGYNVGLRCGRNAQTNAYGLAPKNTPVAGKEWPLNRTGVKQLNNPDAPELSDMAQAKINPVVFEKYNSGGKFVFTDSLTCANVSTSYRKLISVAEMSSTLDDMVVKFSKEALQLPMAVAIKKTTDFLEATFDAAGSTGWLVASDDPALGEKGFVFSVKRNAVRPADRMDIEYGLHYDGVVRAIYVTQTLSR